MVGGEENQIQCEAGGAKCYGMIYPKNWNLLVIDFSTIETDAGVTAVVPVLSSTGTLPDWVLVGGMNDTTMTSLDW